MARDILKLTPNQKQMLRYFLLYMSPGEETGLIKLYRALDPPTSLSSTSARCRALARRGFLMERRGPHGWLWQRGPLCDLLMDRGLDADIIDGRW